MSTQTFVFNFIIVLIEQLRQEGTCRVCRESEDPLPRDGADPSV